MKILNRTTKYVSELSLSSNIQSILASLQSSSMWFKCLWFWEAPAYHTIPYQSKTLLYWHYSKFPKVYALKIATKDIWLSLDFLKPPLSYVSLYHFQLLVLEASIFDCVLFCCFLLPLEREGLLAWDFQNLNFGLHFLLVNRVSIGLSAEVRLITLFLYK